MAKTAPINMRVEPRQQHLLTKAARFLHMDRSTFILEAACREAENVLLDQRLFQLDDADYDQFVELLEQPAPNLTRLKELLSTSPPWDA